MIPHSEEVWSAIARRKARAYEAHREVCDICGKDDKHCAAGLEIAEQMVNAANHVVESDDASN